MSNNKSKDHLNVLFSEIFSDFCKENDLSLKEAWDIISSNLIMITALISDDDEMYNQKMISFFDKSRTYFVLLKADKNDKL